MIEEIATAHGIPVMNLHDVSGFDWKVHTTDGCHPNIEGHRWLAENMNIAVCDCYEKWKELSKTEDITRLLANRTNHPTKEMHEMFAQSLFEVIFSDSNEISQSNDSAMYNGIKTEEDR